MGNSSGRIVFAASAAALATLSIVAAQVFAQTPASTPTAEQLQMLQSLPPAQRDAILQQMGVGQSAGPAALSGARKDQIIVTQPGETTGDELSAGLEARTEERIKGGER